MRIRVALLVLGVWIALTVAMGTAATTTFGTVDEVLAPGHRAELEERLAPRDAAAERPLFRYLASEINRRLFARYEWAQMVLAAVAVFTVLPARDAGRLARVGVSAATALLVVLAAWLGPEVQRLGPPLDFVPRPFPPEWQPRHAEFMRVHGAYMALDLAKLVLLGLAAQGLARRKAG